MCHVFPARLVRLVEAAVSDMGDDPRTAVQGVNRTLALAIEYVFWYWVMVVQAAVALWVLAVVR